MSDVTQRRDRSPSPKNRKDPQDEKKLQELQQKAAQAQKKRSKKQEDTFSKYGYHIVIGAFVVMVVFAVGSTLFRGTRKLSLLPVIDQEEIQSINSQKYSFQVGENEFFNQWMLSDAKGIVNNQLTQRQSLPRCPSVEDTSIIPDKYNFREVFSNCSNPIVSQGNCSSSYAIVAASTIADRYCQQTLGKVKEVLSPQTALQCDSVGSGCQGGSVSRVFDIAKKTGLPNVDCIAYNTDYQNWKNQTCDSTKDCTKLKIIDYCVTHSPEGIKREIFQNGPIVVVIPVYRDFLIYKSGVYRVIEGTSRFQAGHAVKLIGWDKTEQGENYWIVENSWGESWGIKGLVHIAEGQKQLFIEEFAVAPVPVITKEEEEFKEDTQEKVTDRFNEADSQ